MNLTSIRRMLLYCAGDAGTPQANTLANTRILAMWLPSVSHTIEEHLRRLLLLQQYVDFIDTKNAKVEFYLRATPIYSFVDVYEDPRSLWNGNERQVQYAFPGQTGHSIINPYAMNYVQEKAMRIRYMGGIARHAVNSRFSLSSVTGTFVAGQFVIGQSSYAVGIVNSLQSGAIVIEGYYGTFSLGEIIKQFTAEDGSGSSSASGVINTYPEFGFYMETGSEVFAIGQYVQGQTSGNVATVIALEGIPCCAVQVSNANFIDTEAVNVFASSDSILSDILFSVPFRIINNQSLLQVAPEIVMAAEMQIRYARKHGLDFENAGTSKDGTTRRDTGHRGFLLPEVERKLQPYRAEYEY